mgnify:CR=1 FL=1
MRGCHAESIMYRAQSGAVCRERLGKTMLLSRLARPFLTVRAERLIIRGIFGDSFIRVGVPERNAPEVKMPEEYINAQA